MRTFVVGDIHGQVIALEPCVERSGFNYYEDTLICLGDVFDRGKYVKESLEILLKIKNLIYVFGDHEKWFLEWAVEDNEDPFWKYQGGDTTKDSYKDGVPEGHIKLVKNAPWYYLSGNRLFVHAGINPDKGLQEQAEFDLIWSKELVETTFNLEHDDSVEKLTVFDEVFVGHTPTINYGSDKPMFVKDIR